MDDMVEFAASLPQQDLQIAKRLPRLTVDRAVDKGAGFQIDRNNRRIHHAAGDDCGADLMNSLGSNGFRRAEPLFVLSSHFVQRSRASSAAPPGALRQE